MRYLLIIVVLFFSGSVFFESALAKVEQDGGGTWQIDTFETNEDTDSFPYIIVTQTYNPRDGLGIQLSNMTGQISSAACGEAISERVVFAEKYVTNLIETIRNLTKNQYTISVSVSVCHVGWYVVYLHDGKDFAAKDIYDRLWLTLQNI